MLYSEDDLLMISGLQHLIFCKRQCALIHLEGVWAENYLTAQGQVLHSKVDKVSSEARLNVIEVHALRLKSLQLGLTGVADKVEFHLYQEETDNQGYKIATKISGKKGFWKPFPVEYKRGKVKTHRADEIQLCAQALCLEEMLKVYIPQGALFYGKNRRRIVVDFDNELRNLTIDAANEFHNLIATDKTPEAEYMKQCESCSLIEFCLPGIKKHKSAKVWLNNELEKISSGDF